MYSRLAKDQHNHEWNDIWQFVTSKVLLKRWRTEEKIEGVQMEGRRETDRKENWHKWEEKEIV